jgi:hypothetical protein
MILKPKTLILLAAIGFLSCKKQEKAQKQIQNFYENKTILPNDVKTITPTEAKTLHKDTIYEYEYRTGTTVEYEYNYDVKGHDQSRNPVSGSIITSGKQGAGIVTNKKGEQKNIQTEWVDKGKLKAVDEAGNKYELVVD